LLASSESTTAHPQLNGMSGDCGLILFLLNCSLSVGCSVPTVFCKSAVSSRPDLASDALGELKQGFYKAISDRLLEGVRPETVVE